MNIEQAIQKYHFLQRDPSTGALEIYLDHHSMASFRSCEAKFELEILNNIKGKGRAWSLEFGIVFHEMIEKFYLAKRDGNFEYSIWLALGQELWEAANLNKFSEHKTYKALNGFPGFLVLLSQYAEFYANELNNLRPIGIEIAFGKKKEVPLGSFRYPLIEPSLQPHFKLEFDTEIIDVNCYLTGRIDFLMDSGLAIGPLDHKTAAWFSGDMTENHDPQEGMTGYVYATNHIIRANFPELASTRKCDRVWMNYVQVKAEQDFNKRFKRIPIFKTEFQLEQYRLRQVQTCKKIFEFIINGEVATWNTSVCNNMYHQKCPFHSLHRQNNPESMFSILENQFVVAEPWNPEKL